MIGDQELEQFRGETQVVHEPLAYGGLVHSEDQMPAVKLPRGFTTYVRIEDEMVERELESMIAKTGNWQLQELKMSEVYSEEEHRMRFARKRVTDMKTGD